MHSVGFGLDGCYFGADGGQSDFEDFVFDSVFYHSFCIFRFRVTLENLDEEAGYWTKGERTEVRLNMCHLSWLM